MPLPREVPAKLVLPADMPPAPSSGRPPTPTAARRRACSSSARGPEVIEDDARKAPQLLAGLPVTVSGRLCKNEEVDRYRFVAAKDGPITCELMARRLGSKFLADP